MSKSIFKSWTFWFGFLQLALGIVGYASGLMPHAEAMSLMVTGAGTIGLRVKTDTPVSL